MSADNFYWYASVLIFVPWLLLIFMPSWRYTEPVAFGAAFVLLGVAIFFTVVYLISGSAGGGNLFSLEGLAFLFRSKEMLLTGWFNYLSFSLLVGTWQVHDSRQVPLPHWLVAPCLLLTLLAGPTGLLLYLLLRALRKGKWEV